MTELKNAKFQGAASTHILLSAHIRTSCHVYTINFSVPLFIFQSCPNG